MNARTRFDGVLQTQQPSTTHEELVCQLKCLVRFLNSSHLEVGQAGAVSVGEDGPKAERAWALIQAVSRLVEGKTDVGAVHFRFMLPFRSVKDVKQCPFWLDASCTRDRNWTVHIPDHADVVYHSFPS